MTAPGRWVVFSGWLAMAASVPFSAEAEAATTGTTAPSAPNVRSSATPQPSPPTGPSRPGPAVRLIIETPTTYGPWTMRVTNQDDVPVRLVADARLLSLNITPRGARKGAHCELPGDMRPADDDGRGLVLPPKRSYVERFEPRLYCFGNAGFDGLAPGAIVVARLGWPRGAGERIKPSSPFLVSPLEGVEPELAPLPSIESLPVAVPDEPTPTFGATSSAPGPLALEAPTREAAEPDGIARLSLRGAAAVDGATQGEIAVPVTLHNDGARRVVVRFRPETLGFDLVGPSGVDHCVWPGVPAAAMRELFTTLAPNESVSLTVMLSAYCRGHALDQGGLAVIRPWLDTRRGSGAVLGLRTFDGQVIATTATLARLHRGADSLPLEPRARPQLEPLAGPTPAPP